MSALVALTMVGAAATTMASPDELWLRYPKVADRSRLNAYRALLGGGAKVSAEPLPAVGSAALAQLHSVASELETGLSGLLGEAIPVACCCGSVESPSDALLEGVPPGMLRVSVGNISAAGSCSSAGCSGCKT